MAAKKKPSKKKATPSKKTAASKKTAPKKKPLKKKAPSKKKKSSRTHKKNPAKKSLMQRASSFLATLILILLALLIAYVILHPKSPERVPPKKQVPIKTSKFKKPDFEIYPAKPIPPRRPISKNKQTPVVKNHPKVALIIDDLGYHMDTAKKILNLDAVLTCSILPYSPHQKEIIALAKKKGFQVMLHLPMEPNEYPDVNPGPGALYTAMTPDERIRQLKADLDSMPNIIRGVNNHMGSKMTTLSDQMNQIFTVLKKRGLFFVDSRTTAASQCRSSARLFKLPFAERDVFLDHIQTKDAIRHQIEQLINTAEIYGKAVGIAHPHDITYEVLKETLPALKKQIKLVPASEIVEVL